MKLTLNQWTRKYWNGWDDDLERGITTWAYAERRSLHPFSLPEAKSRPFNTRLRRNSRRLMRHCTPLK